MKSIVCQARRGRPPYPLLFLFGVWRCANPPREAHMHFDSHFKPCGKIPRVWAPQVQFCVSMRPRVYSICQMVHTRKVNKLWRRHLHASGSTLGVTYKNRFIAKLSLHNILSLCVTLDSSSSEASSNKRKRLFINSSSLMTTAPIFLTMCLY